MCFALSLIVTLHKKRSFLLSISSVDVTKIFTEDICLIENFIFCAVLKQNSRHVYSNELCSCSIEPEATMDFFYAASSTI